MCRWKVEAHEAQRVVVRQQFHVCSSTAHSLLKVDLVPGSTQGVHTSQDMNYHMNYYKCIVGDLLHDKHVSLEREWPVQFGCDGMVFGCTLAESTTTERAHESSPHYIHTSAY